MSLKINIIPSSTTTPTRNNIIFNTLYRNTTRPSEQEIKEEKERHIPDSYVSENSKICNKKKSLNDNSSYSNRSNNESYEISKNNNSTLNNSALSNENKENNDIVNDKSSEIVNNVSNKINDLTLKDKTISSPINDKKRKNDKIEYSIQSSNSKFKINVIAPEKPMSESMEKRNYWDELREYQLNKDKKKSYLTVPPMHPDLPYLITRKDSFMIPQAEGEWIDEKDTPKWIAQLEYEDYKEIGDELELH